MVGRAVAHAAATPEPHVSAFPPRGSSGYGPWRDGDTQGADQHPSRESAVATGGVAGAVEGVGVAGTGVVIGERDVDRHSSI
jgi:hypothetical protein